MNEIFRLVCVDICVYILIFEILFCTICICRCYGKVSFLYTMGLMLFALFLFLCFVWTFGFKYCRYCMLF